MSSSNSAGRRGGTGRRQAEGDEAEDAIFETPPQPTDANRAGEGTLPATVPIGDRSTSSSVMPQLSSTWLQKQLSISKAEGRPEAAAVAANYESGYESASSFTYSGYDSDFSPNAGGNTMSDNESSGDGVSGGIGSTWGLRRRRQRKKKKVRRRKTNAEDAAGGDGEGAGTGRRVSRRMTTQPLQMAKTSMRVRARQREKEEFLKRHHDVSSYSLSNYGEAKPRRSKSSSAAQEEEEPKQEEVKALVQRIVLVNSDVQTNSMDPADIVYARSKRAKVGGLGRKIAGCFRTNTEIGGIGHSFFGRAISGVEACVGGCCGSMYRFCCFCLGDEDGKAKISPGEDGGDGDGDGDGDGVEEPGKMKKRRLFRFIGNDISTSKYTLITFLPIFLYEVFSRAAYLYFLIQACLTWWQDVSPFSPVGSNVALLFVVVVSGIKAVVEDLKRHREDAKVNNSIALKVELEIVDKSGGLDHMRDNTPGVSNDYQFHHGKVLVRMKETIVRWRDIKVGDMIKVSDDQEFPADLLCMHTSLPEKVCFIKTTNLDGESNLKIRSPPSVPFGRHVVVGDTVIEDSNVVIVDDVQADDDDGVLDVDEKDTSIHDNAVAVLGLQGNISCEPPNANLHVFKGSLEITDVGTTAGTLGVAIANAHTHIGAQPGDAVTMSNVPPPSSSSLSVGASSSKTVPISMDEMLLRGCTLKHTGYIIGCVVYTGSETRIMKNAAKTPLKIGTFDLFLNVQIIIIVIIQILLCIGCALAGWYFMEDHRLDYYLAFDRDDSVERVNGVYSTPGAQIMVNFVTFWILFSYLIPISLFVTMEIVKFVQGTVLINSDRKMVDPATGQCSLARNSNINEDLGKVEYVFSDKTGTLTSNEMQLRQLCIGGHVYGDIDFKVEEASAEAPQSETLRLFDPNLADAAEFLLNTSADEAGVEKIKDKDERQHKLFLRDLGIEMLDTFMVLTVCHSLIVDNQSKATDLNEIDVSQLAYQGPSPDEVAIVDACKKLGFVFLHRSSNTITFRILGELVSYEILNVLEFSSERQRMSVIVRAPDGTVRLYMKGADSRVATLLAPSGDEGDIEYQVMAATDRALSQMSRAGLRTMMLATKVIPGDEYDEWDLRFQDAAATIENREELMREAMEDIEQDLTLVGATGIEDKLQEGVPDAIKTLISAGIKVWMITGDKQETAINIAVSCGLVAASSVDQENADAQAMAAEADSSKLMICNASSSEGASKILEHYMDDIESKEGSGSATTGELVIDGKTLHHILNTEAEWTLAELASRCRAVVVCRASPKQKAAIVRMIMGYTVAIAKGSSNGIVRRIRKTRRRMMGQMLAIGDGANDVAMIQAADIGVGIFGKEGRQAVNNSDYAIGQFRFLVRLLLVHGTLSHYRLARLIKYSFYKNVAFGLMFFYFQFYCGFSGQAIVGSIAAAMYNVVLTSLPILFFAVIDRPLSDTSYVVFPQLYYQNTSLNMRIFWKSILLAMIHSAICFFIPLYSVPLSMNENGINDLYSVGNIVYTCLLITVNLEIAIVSRFWTIIFGIFLLLSILPVWLLFLWLAGFVLNAMEYTDPQINGAAHQLCRNPNFWFAILLTAGLTFGTRLIERTMKHRLNPDDDMIVSAHEQLRNRFLKQKQKARLERIKSGGAASGAAVDGASGLGVEMTPNATMDYGKTIP